MRIKAPRSGNIKTYAVGLLLLGGLHFIKYWLNLVWLGKFIIEALRVEDRSKFKAPPFLKLLLGNVLGNADKWPFNK